MLDLLAMTTDKWDSLPEPTLDDAVRQVEADIEHLRLELTEMKIARRRKRAMRNNDERVRRDRR